jgi:hypothetical protein
MFEAYKEQGMTLGHIAWRRKKIFEEEGREWKVDQEYPNNPEEAFVRAEGRFFDIPKIYQAKARQIQRDEWAPFIIGIDPGRTGDDTVICRRYGRVVDRFQVIKSDDGYQKQMTLAGMFANIIESEKPDMVFIDPAEGGGIIDRLHELGYGKVVRRVHFGEGVLDEQFLNKRAEMGHLAKEWFDNEEASVPDDEEFIADLAAIPLAKVTSSGRKVLVPKDEIKKELKRSPNKGDSFFLTFAYPVRRQMNVPVIKKNNLIRPPYKSCLNTIKTLKGK